MATTPSTTAAAILVQASRILAIRGLHGTSTRDVAAAVGIRQPSLFHHYPSKTAILEALLGYSVDVALAEATALRDAPGSPAARLYRYVRWDIAYCTTSPYDLRGVHRDDVVAEPALAAWAAKLDALHAAIRTIIEQGVAAGELDAPDPEFARQAITGLTLETIRAHGAGSEDEPEGRPERAAEFALRALLLDPARLPAVRAEATAPLLR
jgi:AcrR family transcriptional regulator